MSLHRNVHTVEEYCNVKFCKLSLMGCWKQAAYASRNLELKYSK